MQISIREVGLSTRTRDSLMRNGLRTVEEVISKTDKELLACRGFGQKSLDEIHQFFPDRVRVRKSKRNPKRKNIERLADIVRMRMENHTIRQIAEKYGISNQRVHQILQRAGVRKGDRVIAASTQQYLEIRNFLE